MGNAVAQLALLIWLPLSLWLGSVLSAPRAAATILIGAALFLPERVGYELPLIPTLDKYTIGSLSALIACATSHSRVTFARRHSSAVGWLAAFGALSFLATTVTNPDPIHYGPVVLPGLGLFDTASSYVGFLLRVVLPYYVGQAVFRTPDDLRELLRGLVLGALLYVPLVLFEARFSPQLHIWVYGFFQHDFIQSVRAGGFRAFVFMSHGLAVAFFMSQALTSVVGLGSTSQALLPFSRRAITIVLAVTLITCKSMGPMIYAGVTLPLLWFGKTKAQLRVASWLSILVLLYPLARFFGWIPTDEILAKITEISPERSESLGFRFNMEAILLTHAVKRPYFGWGSWSRNRVFDSNGRDLTVPDGQWILDMGTGGIFYFLIAFGLLLLPVFQAKKAIKLRKPTPEDAQILATTALLLAFTGLDLIPNSMSHPLPLVLAGALTGTSTGLIALRGRTEPSAHAARGPTTSSGALSRGAT